MQLNKTYLQQKSPWCVSELVSFIYEAHINTYAAIESQGALYLVKSNLPEHIDYQFTKGEWSYRDSYTGYYWPPGKEVVFYKNRPCWCMSYQGMMVGDYTHGLAEQTYSFLKTALRSMTVTEPFRGPQKFESNSWLYLFKKEGDPLYFTGREEIYKNGKLMFFQDIMASAIFHEDL